MQTHYLVLHDPSATDALSQNVIVAALEREYFSSQTVVPFSDPLYYRPSGEGIRANWVPVSGMFSMYGTTASAMVSAFVRKLKSM